MCCLSIRYLRIRDSFLSGICFLGNGFSIECCPDIFHYGSLFERADFGNRQELARVFKQLGTEDFEVAIRSLEGAAKLIPIYTPTNVKAAAQMVDDAAALKGILLTNDCGEPPQYPCRRA